MHARFLAFFLALMLLTAPAQAATQTFSGLFSVEYDEHVYTLDTATWLDHSDGKSRWLMMLGAEDYLIDVNLNFAKGWEHLSLTNPDDPMTEWYLEERLTDGVDHLGNVSANGALFCLFRTSDADGEYLLGETVANGWAVRFYAYYDDPDRPVDDALQEALEGLLNHYKPER